MDLQKSILQKDVLLEISRILRHIYSKWSYSIIYYPIWYKYVYLSIYIYLSILYVYIYLLDIYIYIIYIYIYIYLYMYIGYIYIQCLLQHCHNTYIRWSHWCYIHIIFSSWFYLIIVTRRKGLPNCEHDPSYQ